MQNIFGGPQSERGRISGVWLLQRNLACLLVQIGNQLESWKSPKTLLISFFFLKSSETKLSDFLNFLVFFWKSSVITWQNMEPVSLQAFQGGHLSNLSVHWRCDRNWTHLCRCDSFCVLLLHGSCRGPGHPLWARGECWGRGRAGRGSWTGHCNVWLDGGRQGVSWTARKQSV